MAPLTGSVSALIQADNGNVIAASDDFGTLRIYRSTDDGQTWSTVFTATAILPAIQARPHKFAKDGVGNLYLAVTSEPSVRGIYKSVDHGVTWTRINSIPQISHLTGSQYGATGITFAQQGTVLLATVAGTLTSGDTFFLRSNNLGASWFAHTLLTGVMAQSTQQATTVGPGNLIPAGVIQFAFISYTPSVPLFYMAFSTGNISGPSSHPFVGGTPTQPVRLVGLNFEDSDGRSRYPILVAMQNSTQNIWMQGIAGAQSQNEVYPISDIPVPEIHTLYLDPLTLRERENTVWAGCSNGQIYVSYNNGYSWSLFETTDADEIHSFVRTTSGVLISGGNEGEIFLYGGSGGSGGGGTGDPGDEEEEEDGGSTPGGSGGGGGTDPGTSIINTFALGREETQIGLVPIANKFSFFNITHVLNYNGSTYTSLQFSSNPPYTLFSSTPAVGQMVYFGSRTVDPAAPGGTFSSLVFNISQAAQNFSVLWEYYDGSTWVELDVRDNTNQFRYTDENSVHWSVPSDWEQTTINSVSGYWVRVQITQIDDVGEVPTPPIHDLRFIYTINLPYVGIGQRQVGGDIPALGQVIWKNLCDNSNENPQLPVDRLVVGLRSVSSSRGQNFNAFINITDQQSPFGITVSSQFANSEFIEYLRSPSNRAYQFFHDVPDTLDAWNNMIDITIDTTVARDYYGTYRAFVRCAVDDPGDEFSWKYRLKISFGSGGAVKYTKEFPVQLIGTDFVCLDMGAVSIPSTTIFSVGNNIGDSLKITIQGYCTDEDVTSRLYDLILIPVDEWAGDGKLSDLLDATVPNKVNGSNYLDFDSISNLKANLSTYNRQASGLIKSIYQSINNGPLILQKNVRQRFWFLSMLYNYGSNMWISNPEVAGDVKIFKVQRYKAMRGKR